MNPGAQSPEPVTLGQIYRQQMEASRQAIQEPNRRSIEHCRKALKQDDQDANLYVRLAQAHQGLFEHEAAIDVFRAGLDRCASSAPLHRAYVQTLHALNRTEEAIGAARQALTRFPDDWWFRLKEALLLPLVYESTAEIDYYRQRFSSGLASLAADPSLETPAARRSALKALASHVNFYLPYQGYNDVQLQRVYGNFVHRIVTANFPDWARAVPMPEAGGKLRIGYASASFTQH